MSAIYLNTAATGILPAEFTQEADKLYRQLSSNASTHAEYWRDNELPHIRQSVASFIGTTTANLAFLPNFSWGINAIVHSLQGDEKVLLYAADYPSLLEPFRINNFAICWIEDEDGFTISSDKLKEKLLADKINVLAISHVQWMSGFKADLADLGAFCRQHDIRFIVDATQSIGAIPIDVRAMNVDVLIASNYKWMNAGFGTGIMYISDDFLERYTPAVGGHGSYTVIEGEPQYIPGITSFEPGHLNMHGLTVLDAAVDDKINRGVRNIYDHNRSLTQLLLDEIRGLDIELVGEDSTANRASIVFLRSSPGLWNKLKENNIIVALRGNIRISMHYHNTEEDVMKLVNVLKSV